MKSTRSAVDWIAVDWGTSRLRAWLHGPEMATPLALSSGRGAGALAPAEFEGALLELIGEHLPVGRSVEVICCGMVGAVRGWVHAPYAPLPCRPSDPALAVRAPTVDPRLSVLVLPGVSQRTPADVMRGEETQLAGLLAAEPGHAGIVCLPGTHSKWTRLGGGRIEEFGTYLTGELFALLSRHSTLSQGMAGSAWDEESFTRGVERGVEAPESLLGELFPLRARVLCEGLSAGAARGRLSGLLIGAELADARRFWQGSAVTLVGEEGLVELYALALSMQGVRTRVANAVTLTLDGLRAARRALEEAGT